MAYNESSYKAANAYKKQNIKRVPLDMQISDYEQLKAAADACGEKVNEYIKNAIRINDLSRSISLIPPLFTQCPTCQIFFVFWKFGIDI